MPGKRKTPLAILLVLLLLAALPAAAQSSYLESGVNGVGVDVVARISLDAFEQAGLRAGYSISGVLDLGANLGIRFGGSEGDDTVETRVAILYNVNVLEQSRLVPLSLQIFGSYGLMNVSSDSLSDSSLIKTGTGYTIGADLYWDISLLSVWGIRFGATASYESTNYQTTTEVLPPEGSDYPISNRVRNVIYGGMLGFLFTTIRGVVFAPLVKVVVNQDLDLFFEPQLSLVIPSKPR